MAALREQVAKVQKELEVRTRLTWLLKVFSCRTRAPPLGWEAPPPAMGTPSHPLTVLSPAQHPDLGAFPTAGDWPREQTCALVARCRGGGRDAGAGQQGGPAQGHGAGCAQRGEVACVHACVHAWVRHTPPLPACPARRPRSRSSPAWQVHEGEGERREGRPIARALGCLLARLRSLHACSSTRLVPLQSAHPLCLSKQTRVRRTRNFRTRWASGTTRGAFSCPWTRPWRAARTSTPGGRRRSGTWRTCARS